MMDHQDRISRIVLYRTGRDEILSTDKHGEHVSSVLIWDGNSQLRLITLTLTRFRDGLCSPTATTSRAPSGAQLNGSMRRGASEQLYQAHINISIGRISKVQSGAFKQLKKAHLDFQSGASEESNQAHSNGSRRRTPTNAPQELRQTSS